MDLSKLKPRAEHMLTIEAFYHVVVVIALLTAIWAVYLELNRPLGNPPLTTVNENVPAVGDQGYNVAAFCSDSNTSVTKDLFTPPDSTFVNTYTLERTKDGKHEVVTVGVYANPAKQPVATHYDSSNTPMDAFVSKDAMSCILSKAK